jgi:hypothetical protein
MFCKHKWKGVLNITTESNVEAILKLGTNPSSFSYSGTDLTRKNICDYVCLKCGKLKRFETTL